VGRRRSDQDRDGAEGHPAGRLINRRIVLGRRRQLSAAQVWPANSHPPDLFSGNGQPRLSLITCTGKYDRFTQTYGDRLIVEATYVGAA